MADKTHLEILMQGVSPWNEWRKNDPKLVPDFSGADLSGMKLANVNFRNANLDNTNFTGTDLTGADLTGASFNEAMGLTWQGGPL